MVTPIETIPVFVRAGSFIPMQEPTLTSKEDDGPLLLYYWHDVTVSEAVGQLYEDDGRTRDAEKKGHCEVSRFEASADRCSLTVRMDRDGGAYPGRKKLREFHLVVHHWLHAPTSVQVQDKPLQRWFGYRETSILTIPVRWESNELFFTSRPNNSLDDGPLRSNRGMDRQLTPFSIVPGQTGIVELDRRSARIVGGPSFPFFYESTRINHKIGRGLSPPRYRSERRRFFLRRKEGCNRPPWVRYPASPSKFFWPGDNRTPGSAAPDYPIRRSGPVHINNGRDNQGHNPVVPPGKPIGFAPVSAEPRIRGRSGCPSGTPVVPRFV